MTRNIFYGPDILSGLALGIIRELRLIGGEMQKDFIQLMKTTVIESLHNPENFSQVTKEINLIVSSLFRVEAKIPALVYLKNQKFRFREERVLKNAIMRDDVDTLKRYLSIESINNKISDNRPTWFEVSQSTYESIPLDTRTEIVTPLISATVNGSSRVITWLLSKGANPNIKDMSGKTYENYLLKGLFNCALQGELEKLQYFLINYPEYLNKCDKHGNTVLLHAAEYAQLEIIQWLTLAGADQFHTNKQGETYLHKLGKYAYDTAHDTYVNGD